MSPQLTIISAAMSLGGMASVGYSHYGQVEKQVAEYQLQVDEEVEQMEIAEVGEQMAAAVADLTENFQSERQKDRADFEDMLRGVAAEVEMVKQQTSAHNVLMESLSQQQDTLDFRMESLSGKFRPLRAIDSRFQPIKSESKDAHPLLPPVEQSWTDQY